MRRFAAAVFGVLAVFAGTVPLSPPANAAVGEVVVYIAEIAELVVYDNPKGCYDLPVGGHVITNRTNRHIEIFAVADCGGGFPTPPILVLGENHGSHVPPSALSFKA